MSIASWPIEKISSLRNVIPSVFLGWLFVFVSGVVRPTTPTVKPLKSYT